MNSLALFQAAPLIAPEIAKCNPLTITPIINPATILAPIPNPRARGNTIIYVRIILPMLKARRFGVKIRTQLHAHNL
jgi:hypothetical protein